MPVSVRIRKELAKSGFAFIDGASLQRRIDKGTNRALVRSGAYVRTTARRSLKRPPSRSYNVDGTARKRRLNARPKRSRPGEPPYNRSGVLRDFIFFAYDRQSKEVVIGPIPLNRPGGGPEVLKALEFGGPSRLEFLPNRPRVRVQARPFMRPALARAESVILENFRGLVSQGRIFRGAA